MPSTIPDELIELKNSILDGMLEYIQADDEDEDDFIPAYSQDKVAQCDVILSTYLTEVLAPAAYGHSEKIMAIVEKTVISLNTLNEDCDCSLIETDQREGICELIINTALQAGLKTATYDITEEWRDW